MKVHFVGIGGIGMSGLARILLAQGHGVSGSDLRLSPLTDSLEAKGALIHQGHAAANLGGADLVVVTSAAATDNPEVKEAVQRGIPVIKRAELLARIMSERLGVAVAGTHGKTTTSALLAFLLDQAGLDPTIVVGGEIIDLGTNARLGQGKYVVAEADEFDGSFLRLSPHLAVVTNVDADHLDCYGSYERVVDAFAQFMDNVAPSGTIIACADDLGVRRAIAKMSRPVVNTGRSAEACPPSAHRLDGLGANVRVRPGKGTTATDRAAGPVECRLITYGLDSDANWVTTSISRNNRGGHDFAVSLDGEVLGVFSNALPGRHNVANSLAAIAAASSLGVDPVSLQGALSRFRGTKRRFEVQEVAGVTIVDDYGHHPTEIRATLQAARDRFGSRRLFCVFQPHTYSRTKHLFSEFATCFEAADTLIMTDIYAARERDNLGVSSEGLVAAIRRPPARYIRDLTGVAEYLLRRLAPGDVVLTVGAGDVDKVAKQIAKELAERHGEP